jgi:2-keto-3-deoxy-L-arabinonate dehydratase
VNRFEGIFPIVNTTFDEAGGLDLDSQLCLVRFLLDCGAHGLGLFGTAGEGYTLSGEERLTLLRVIRREVNGRIPIIVSRDTPARMSPSRSAGRRRRKGRRA